VKINLSQLRGTKSGSLPKIVWKNFVTQWISHWRKFWVKAKVESPKTFPIVADVPQEHFVQTNGNGANGHAQIKTKPKTISINLHWKTFAVGIVAGLILCLGLFFALTSHSKHISTDVAKNHIGESMIVVGTVSEVHVTRKGTVLLDMDGNFPNEQFTAVWFAPNAPTAALQNFSGKTISVKGTIQAYQGRPEIILTSLSQIAE
jgi:DNA/RNA endonuclease YhcR with UshA esterase domain